MAIAVTDELRAWAPRDDVALLVTGIGPVEAACAVSTALAVQRYELVINAGIAGAFNGAAEIGDGVVVAEDTMELDLEGGAQLVLPAGATVVDCASSDATLVASLHAKGFASLRGITVAHVTSRRETARQMMQRGAQVESMEGFAVLRAAQRAKVPAIELRGISNLCGERKSSGWNFEAGVTGLQRVTQALFELLDESVKTPS